MSFGAFEALESLLRGHHQRLHPQSYPKASSAKVSSSTTNTTTSFAELRRRINNSGTAAAAGTSSSSSSTAARLTSLSMSMSGTASSVPTAASSTSDYRSRLVPSANLNESRDCVRVLVDLPGVPAQDVNVTLEHGVLEISGTRRIMSDDGSTCLKRQKFGRRYAIDVDVVDVGKATAVLANGVLTVRAPKKDERSQSLVRIPVVDASAVAAAMAAPPDVRDERRVVHEEAVLPGPEAERREPTTRPTLIPNGPAPSLPRTNKSSTASTRTSTSNSASSSSSRSAKSSKSSGASSLMSGNPRRHPTPPSFPLPARPVKTSVTASSDPIRAYVTRNRQSQHQLPEPQQAQQPLPPLDQQQPLPPMPSESESSTSTESESSTSTASAATPTTRNHHRRSLTATEEAGEGGADDGAARP